MPLIVNPLKDYKDRKTYQPFIEPDTTHYIHVLKIKNN